MGKGKLTALGIKHLGPGLHNDGAGLYLAVGASGSKSWIYRFRWNGKLRDMGLGSLDVVSLAEARTLAAEARKKVHAGTDPIAENRATRGTVASTVMTFDEAARKYIESHRNGWRNAKHAAQWEATLRTYASPVIGALDVADVELRHVLGILEPIWQTKTETASRVRSRIENILDWATVRGYRSGENPARWRGRLDKILPKRSAVQRVKHHRALPYRDVPAFLAILRERTGVAALAFEFMILTATRTGETRGAKWDEIDVDSGTWLISATRMKAGKEHRVPLVGRALEIVETMPRVGDYVFPTVRHEDRPLSENGMLALLKRMGRNDVTPHGFRSSFRDWCSEQTAFPHEVCEQALAHTITNAVERAYRRGDLFEKRRQLMAAWGRFCTAAQPTGDVIPLHARNHP